MNAYLRYFLLLPIEVFLTIVAFVFAPIMPLFADEKGYLPKWLWWFQTPDNPLDGDESYQTKPGRAPFTGILTGWKGYANRVAWLWRNPIYGFGWGVLAFTVQPGYKVELIKTNRDISTFPVNEKGELQMAGTLKHDGYFWAKLTNPDGSWVWQVYVTHHWNDEKCTKLNFGWKIWMADSIHEGMESAICAYTFNPVNWVKTI